MSEFGFRDVRHHWPVRSEWLVESSEGLKLGADSFAKAIAGLEKEVFLRWGTWRPDGVRDAKQEQAHSLPKGRFAPGCSVWCEELTTQVIVMRQVVNRLEPAMPCYRVDAGGGRLFTLTEEQLHPL